MHPSWTRAPGGSTSPVRSSPAIRVPHPHQGLSRGCLQSVLGGGAAGWEGRQGSQHEQRLAEAQSMAGQALQAALRPGLLMRAKCAAP